MRVSIPTPLRSYTGGAKHVDAAGDTVAEVLGDLDRQFPGIRFRVVDEQGALRQHIKIWVDAEQVKDLGAPVSAASEVTLMQALSGG